MPDVSTIASNIEQREDGVWVAAGQRDVSYPHDGNDACLVVENTSFWFQHRNHVISQLVTDFSPDEDFFDIGGGNGCVSEALQAAGLEVVLIEPGPDGAKNAKQRGIRTVVQSTLEDAGFARDSIPSAGLFDVIEHIEDDAQFLKLIHRFLQPAGTLYVTVPTYQYLWSYDDVEAGHFRRYTHATISNLLKLCGFEIKYCSYFFSFLVAPVFLLRAVPSWLGLRRPATEESTRNEHSTGGGFVHSIVQRLLNSELDKIRRRQQIRFGTSCVAVAEKVSPANR